jgi:hypothetical protein
MTNPLEWQESSHQINILQRDLLQLLTVAIVMSAVVAALSRTEAEPDLWGHLRFGLDFLRDGRIAWTDPYSYLSEGRLWINHEWLSEVIFALAWEFGKVWGLVLLKVSMGISIFICVYWFLVTQSLNPLRAGILSLLSFYLLNPSIGTVRPQLFTVLFFSLVFLILVRAESKQYRLLWFMPLIFLFWANLHGGFLAGLAILGLWMFLHLLKDKKSWKDIIPPLAAAILASFINPYGPGLLVFLLKTATVPRPEISEWQPLLILSKLGFAYLILLFISILGILYTSKKRESILIAIFVFLALLPFTAVRHIPLFSLGAIYFAGPYIADCWNSKGQTSNKIKSSSTILLSIGLIVGIILLNVYAYTQIGEIKVQGEFSYPISAVSLLKQSGVSGNLAVNFNWGEYVIWHLGDKIKVSIDGRRETVYSQKIYTENLSFTYGSGEWDKLLKETRTDLALVVNNSAADNLLKLSPDWSFVYEDNVSSLFARNDFPSLQQLQEENSTLRHSSNSFSFP